MGWFVVTVPFGLSLGDFNAGNQLVL